MRFFQCIFLCSIVAGVQIVNGGQELVKVSLYYEALCPYSIDFVTEQLYPGYKELEDSLIVDLIPYGKANQTLIDGKWTFKCQHGPRECHGNKIQACVLKMSVQRSDKMGFVNCIMNSTNPSSDKNAENCALENHVSWTDLQTCVENGDGDNALADLGARTKSLTPKLTYVPHILFNGMFDGNLEDKARRNFLKTVCSLYNVKPYCCLKKRN